MEKCLTIIFLYCLYGFQKDPVFHTHWFIKKKPLHVFQHSKHIIQEISDPYFLDSLKVTQEKKEDIEALNTDLECPLTFLFPGKLQGYCTLCVCVGGGSKVNLII